MIESDLFKCIVSLPLLFFCRSLLALIYDAVVLDYQAGKDGDCEILTVIKNLPMACFKSSV